MSVCRLLVECCWRKFGVKFELGVVVMGVFIVFLFSMFRLRLVRDFFVC